MFRIDTVLKAAADQSWLICRVIFAGYLGVLTVMDIRNKRLNLLFLLSGFLLMTAGFFCKREIHPLLLATGAGVGIVFLLASRVTGESFGYGDSILIMILRIRGQYTDHDHGRVPGILGHPLPSDGSLSPGGGFLGDHAGPEEIQPENGLSFCAVSDDRLYRRDDSWNVLRRG